MSQINRLPSSLNSQLSFRWRHTACQTFVDRVVELDEKDFFIIPQLIQVIRQNSSIILPDQVKIRCRVVCPILVSSIRNPKNFTRLLMGLLPLFVRHGFVCVFVVDHPVVRVENVIWGHFDYSFAGIILQATFEISVVI